MEYYFQAIFAFFTFLGIVAFLYLLTQSIFLFTEKLARKKRPQTLEEWRDYVRDIPIELR